VLTISKQAVQQCSQQAMTSMQIAVHHCRRQQQQALHQQQQIQLLRLVPKQTAWDAQALLL
jgi:BMFP domain-containing protein YqiC